METIHTGRSVKADLVSLDLGDGPMVVKDFGNKGPWVRFIGRLQIGRERRAYRALDGVEGIPAYYGRIDPWALVIERLDGRPLGLPPEKGIDGPRRFEELARIVARIHERGVLHLDLRALRNVLVRSDGRVVVIDFASAIRLRPGGLLHRLLFRFFSRTDRAAVVKWKQLLEAGSLTAEERKLAEHHRRWRGRWPFNKQRRKRSSR